MVDGVEELPDIDLDDPATFHSHRRVPERLQRLMGRATGTKAIRAVVELLRVALADHHGHRTLQDLVLEGRNTDRTSFRPIALRDVHTTHRRRPVTPRFRAIEERLEVRLQLLRVLLRGLSIDPGSTVLPRASIGFA